MYTSLRYEIMNSDNLEQTHEKLSLTATKDTEEEILAQIEKDFNCNLSAIDIIIELEVFVHVARFGD